MLWGNLTSRCTEGTPAQKRDPCYLDCMNNFVSYDEFTEWCQDQYGYMNKNLNGRFWSLGKDILSHGNKIYSPETCMFVPQVINSVMVGNDQSRGEFPIGVHLLTKGNYIRYIAECKQKVGNGYLGSYLTPEEAHAAWQVAKVKKNPRGS